MTAAQQAECDGAGQWFLVPVPTFLNPAVAWRIPGAKSTVLVPVRWDGASLQELSKEAFARLGMDRAAVEQAAAENAARLLAGIEPEYHRDAKQVIRFAKLSMDQPLAACVVWAPGFAQRFENTLGPKPLVAVPNRFTVFVFPALAGDCDEFAPMILAAWRETPFPASRELLQAFPEGVRAIGRFCDP